MMPQAEQKATTDQSNEEFHRQISCHLNAIYYSKLRPLEEKVNYFEEAFDCVTLEHRPIVLLVGPYSSGKTSFIEYILDESFTFTNIGPHPSTDSFDVFSYGDQKSDLFGQSAICDKRYPFSGLQKYPDSFKNRFKIHEYNNRLLQSVTFIDTPGILSGKETFREFEFSEPLRYLFEVSSKVIFMLDIEKVDISSEMKNVLQLLRSEFANKFLLVVNKCHKLQSVKDAIFLFSSVAWQLCLTLGCPEMPRFYCVSFQHHFEEYKDGRRKDSKSRASLNEMLRDQSNALLSEFLQLHKQQQLSVLHDLTVRCKRLSAFIKLSAELRSKYFSHFSQEMTIRAQIQKNLRNEIEKLCSKNHNSIFPTDFHNQKLLRESLARNASKKLVHAAKPKYFSTIDQVKAELARLQDIVRQRNWGYEDSGLSAHNQLSSGSEKPNPFILKSNMISSTSQPVATSNDSSIVNRNSAAKYIARFLAIVESQESGSEAKVDLSTAEMGVAQIRDALKSIWPDKSLEDRTLGYIWALVFGHTGGQSLRVGEFLLICFCVECVIEEAVLPKSIPDHWIKLVEDCCSYKVIEK